MGRESTMSDPAYPAAASGAATTGDAMFAYIEDMLLELAHMASAGGDTALAATLAIAAIQAGTRAKGR